MYKDSSILRSRTDLALSNMSKFDRDMSQLHSNAWSLTEDGVGEVTIFPVLSEIPMCWHILDLRRTLVEPIYDSPHEEQLNL